MHIEQYFQSIWAINSIGRVPPLHGTSLPIKPL